VTPAPKAQPLTDAERELLDFSGLWFRYEGHREAAILDLFGVSAIRFHQRVNKLIDREEALAYAPILVNRLRNERQNRREQRAQKPVGVL
jgi:hypothetical protein